MTWLSPSRFGSKCEKGNLETCVMLCAGGVPPCDGRMLMSRESVSLA